MLKIDGISYLCITDQISNSEVLQSLLLQVDVYINMYIYIHRERDCWENDVPGGKIKTHPEVFLELKIELHSLNLATNIAPPKKWRFPIGISFSRNLFSGASAVSFREGS